MWIYIIFTYSHTEFLLNPGLERCWPPDPQNKVYRSAARWRFQSRPERHMPRGKGEGRDAGTGQENTTPGNISHLEERPVPEHRMYRARLKGGPGSLNTTQANPFNLEPAF